MKTRYDKLVVVRQTESRLATVAFAMASADVVAQRALAGRLQGALESLAILGGPTSAAEMAARMELASRMAAAQGVAGDRINDAQAAQTEAGVARQSARRALDAARDIRRVAVNDVIRRQEAKALPTTPEVPFK
jgi:hypothetical protein